MKHIHWIPIVVGIAAVACKKNNPAVAVVTTAAATNITATSAVSGGTIVSNGGSAITISGIFWATHATPTFTDSIIKEGSLTGSFASPLNSLNPNTTYYVRAYAINGVGTAYGNLDSFKTAPGLATVTTTAITNIVPLSALGGGSVWNDGGSPVTARGICWSISAHPTTANFRTSDSTGTGSFVDSLTNLGSQTFYYVRAYATNSSGTAYGNEIGFSAAPANTVSDFDGNVYPYIRLGTQFWMAANLRTTHFQNGDPITNGLSHYNWATSTTGAYTYPNGDSATNVKFGKIYDLYVVNDPRNACPAGWHIPTDAEWQTLEFYEGMTPADTGTNNRNARGSIGAKFLAGGSTGLNLLNAGIEFNGAYYLFNRQGYYFTSTPSGATGNYYRGFNSVSGDPGPITRGYGPYGLSIRCIKN